MFTVHAAWGLTESIYNAIDCKTVLRRSLTDLKHAVDVNGQLLINITRCMRHR